NGGDMHWDIFGTGNARYEVPKGNGVHSGFAASLWIGGLDAGGQIHTACQTYRQTGNDFWPGPLDTTNATTNLTNITAFDKIWKVDYNDINTFITQYNLGNVPLSYTPTPDILTWPAKGTGNNSRNLAPFVDVNNNGIYDPMVGGDYPNIKGDQTLYFIFNDNFNSHTETGGLPFGVEIHAMAYSYGCGMTLSGRNELAYTTFYDYRIYNRSNNNYNNVYIGFWNDADLGCYNDDYISCSVQNNLGFMYNSIAIDGCGPNGYANYPPAIGTTVLKGPLAPIGDGIDNNNNGVIDEANEQCLMNVFDYYNNNIGSFPVSTTNPKTKYHFYNLLQGNWKDSTKFTCGGTGYGGTIPTKFVFPWNNYTGNPCGTWTELTASNLTGDRRYIVSSGPFNLPAYGVTETEYAHVWSVDSSATTNRHIASANKLILDVQKIRSFYSSTQPNCLLSINTGINNPKLNDSSLSIYPNPASSLLYIKSEETIGKSQIKVTDMLGKTVLESKSTDLYQTSINIEQLNSGIYFLNIKFDNNKSIVKKFVKN
ncbi:MAG TPA: T9SS type A sorting domain-containing protein, partial [Bacteroidia bacterium]|nr:T9SS type A sorting domain-containing protein [Bacteroidia bacterium]